MNEINVNEELKIIENSLRDIISFALNIKYGNNWINKLNISKEKLESWENKKAEETKRFRGEVIDSRLIYYSEFHDLVAIIDKHWSDVFKDVFKEKKEIDVYLDKISSYRIAIAHNRELREHQKNFLVGASGIIRHMITEYKADKDNEDSYYPKFQNIFINDLDIMNIKDSINLYEKKYHVNDDIEVVVNVASPPDIEVTYAIVMSNEITHTFSIDDFSKSNRKKFKLRNEDIPRTKIFISIKSNQDYHRYGKNDLYEERNINVLPNK